MNPLLARMRQAGMTSNDAGPVGFKT